MAIKASDVNAEVQNVETWTQHKVKFVLCRFNWIFVRNLPDPSIYTYLPGLKKK